MVPSLYFEYLRDGDARQLKRVFYHNEIDVLSLSALLNHIAAVLEEPHLKGKRYASDLLSLGRLFEEVGEVDVAVSLYNQGLEHKDTLTHKTNIDLLITAIFRLSMIYKRNGKYKEAVKLWEQASNLNHFGSYIELAKYYEHKVKEFDRAVYWTQTALKLINSNNKNNVLPFGVTIINKQNHTVELNHRLSRLKKKLEK